MPDKEKNIAPKVAKCFTEFVASLLPQIQDAEEAARVWRSVQSEPECNQLIQCLSRLRGVLEEAVAQSFADSAARWLIHRERDALLELWPALMRRVQAGLPRDVMHLFDQGGVVQQLFVLVYKWPPLQVELTNDEVRSGREVGVAIKFLELYNARFGTNYVIADHRDKPDFDCVDSRTARHLYLEVTDLIDRDDDIAYALGRGLRTSTEALSWADTRSQLHRILMEKSGKCYCLHPLALVVRQINPLWSVSGWQACARTHSLCAQYANLPFDHGVWVLTKSDDDASSYDIFCLVEPRVGQEA